MRGRTVTPEVAGFAPIPLGHSHPHAVGGPHWDPWTFPPIFVGGLCLAWLYYRTNSLWTSIALHACINGVAFVAWLLL